MRGVGVILGLLLAVFVAGCAEEPRRPDTLYSRKDVPPLASLTADYVELVKSKRRLRLFADGRILAEYDVALGFTPEGHKRAQGDGRTPEGLYTIDRRNPESAFHLSLGISYPSPEDRSRAAAAGLDPGGDIFIHGQPNGSRDGARIKGDWTNGCIAVTDKEMRQIWSRVPTGIPIAILP